MFKLISLVAVAFFAGGMGLVFAQEAAPVALQVSAGEETHPMTFELKDRIKNQRERIEQGLNKQTLSKNEASNCLEVLKSVESQMKADFKASSSNKMSAEQFAAFNKTLNRNSSVVHEDKEYFYYYEPYYDRHYFLF